jgi:hypothetical protein
MHAKTRGVNPQNVLLNSFSIKLKDRIGNKNPHIPKRTGGFNSKAQR